MFSINEARILETSQRLEVTSDTESMRGWRNTVGDLIELLGLESYGWLRKACRGLQFTGMCAKNSDSSNSRFQTVLVQTVFRQPLSPARERELAASSHERRRRGSGDRRESAI